MRIVAFLLLGAVGIALATGLPGQSDGAQESAPENAGATITETVDANVQGDDLRDEVERLTAEVARLRAERDEGRLEIAKLREELALREERRTQRELEWFQFTRVLSSLEAEKVIRVPTAPNFIPEAELESEAAAPLARFEAAVELERKQRAERARIDLNALMLAEHVTALDFLEVGRINDGWAGPIVVRELDGRGRMIGSLAADRMRLEASRAGRCVTLVFEDGWSSRGGVKVPFGPATEETVDPMRSGVRRIALPGVEPDPWIEAFPELLQDDDLFEIRDDGRWNLIELRLTLDERLRLDSPNGAWRLVAVGGVMGGELTDVHLAQLGSNGRVSRRLFADTLRIKERGKGIELQLRDGVIERNGDTSPFLEGRYRLYMPDADPAVWKAAGTPGLSSPK